MGEIQLRVAGCGDAFGSGGRLNACFFVQGASGAFLIDCGASALIGMKRFGVDPATIDTVLISHLHGDHFGGLPFLIRETQILRSRSRPLVIAGPPATRERLAAAMESFFPGSSRLPSPWLSFQEFEDRRTLHLGPLTVTPFKVLHTESAQPFGFRVECEGRVIAYSGDTEWSGTLTEIARESDLFLCESFGYSPMRHHLDFQTLASRRGELFCRRLILTHLGPDMVRRQGDLEAEFAEDGENIFV
jgi:ribonuclease BN (tRNA processing enzyme)